MKRPVTPEDARRTTLIAVGVTLLVHGIAAATLRTVLNNPRPVQPPKPLEVSLVTPPPPPPRTIVMPKPLPPRTIRAAKPELPKPVEPVAKPRPPIAIVEPPPVALAQPPKPPVVAPVDQPIARPIFDAAYLNNPTPPYPGAARRMRLEGTVVLRVLVSPSGRPRQIEIKQSSGTQMLDQAALSAVRGWTFIPARQGDKAVTAAVDVPIWFHLN